MSKILIAFGYHDQNAPRHWNVKRDLEREGYEVRECHTTEQGLIRKYRDLSKKFHEQKFGASEMLVTFPGHYLMPLAWVLSHLSPKLGRRACLPDRQVPASKNERMKLIFDAFISLSDSIVSDRHKVSWLNPYAWFLYIVDVFVCHLADEVWIDTEEHRKFFMKRFFLNPDRIRTVYLKARSDIFSPRAAPPHKNPGDPVDVLFYGTYIPLQGIEHILRAAKILENNPKIHFTLIGSGQTYKPMRALAEELQLTNVTFHERVPFAELPDRIRKADLCLGIFTKGGKASRVIPHKVYDAVSCGVPVLTSDTPAIHEKFTDGKEASPHTDPAGSGARVILCKAGDSGDIAEKILEFVRVRFREPSA